MPREALVALLYFLAKLPRLSVIASSPAFKWNANYFFSPAIPAPFKPRYLTAFWSWPMDTLPHVSSPIFIQTSYPSPSSSTTIPDLSRLSSFPSTYRFAHGSLLFIDRSDPAIVIFLPPSLSLILALSVYSFGWYIAPPCYPRPPQRSHRNPYLVAALKDSRKCK